MISDLKLNLDKAVNQYGADSIDLNMGDGIACVMFHSRNNSFGIGDSVDLDLLSESEIVELEKYADLLGCGICG